ncbi:TonB-dependent receptor [Parachryseolinea silvisoli]|uniref:TonB-dependent receptor n=1 Tax=Parachryseolinea silvisoli TaxID=2873601 RepID=UPI002265BFF0|nr:TonB-dependent receptor [Parachryseolinea silvisoli]MCD9020122.1 TonB-dependent receptor [Parachryseolinea silvisoli]
MRVSLFYLFLTVLSLQLLLANASRGQGLEDIQVTLELKDERLKDVFKKIEKQTGLLFAYQPQQVNAYTGISLQKSTRSVKEFLDLILENTPLAYRKVNESVIVFKKPLEREESISDEQGPVAQIVSGTVLDKETNQPLPGVSVMIKGTTRGTVTNGDGKYTLEVEENDVLVFSFIGFVTIEAATAGKTQIDIALELNVKSLDEVVVIGYGTTTRRLATGSVAQIGSSEIASQPVTNVLQALQGRLAGVSVTQANGLPGAGFSVQIRGENSLAGRNQPLYIVDGVPYMSTPINQQSQTLTPTNPSGYVLPSAEGQTNPLNSINPSDIESIDVLKDADATAIYGSRAANGVVLITTKKGRAGKTQFTVNASTGTSRVPHFVETLGTPEYLRLRALGLANAGTVPTAANAPELTVWDQNAYTDFQKLLLGNAAKTHDVTASLSGGDRRTTFFISGTFHKENNVFTQDQGYHRGSVNFSAAHTTDNEKLQVGLSVIYSGDKNDISVLDLTSIAYTLAPNFPLYNDDGSLYWTGAVLGTANPLANFKRVNENKTTNLISNMNIRYTVLPGLDLKTTLGFSRTDMDQMALTPMAAQDPAVTSNQARSAFSYNITHNYIVEPQLTYTREIWEGKLDVLVGGTWQFQNSKQPFYVLASNFISDEFITNLSAAQTKSINSTSQQYKYASVFARVGYNIRNKYLANISFRRDGSSRFGPKNKFGNFGSVGAAWIFSEEGFLKNLGLSWLTFGKLRGSYGIVGSDNISNYEYLETYQSGSYIYNGVAGLSPNRIANDEFKWEETRKLEGALEIGLLNDRVILTTALYRNRTENQLRTYPISAQSGFTSYQSNLPATVQNAGLEIGVTSTIVKQGDFTWSTSVNYSRNHNKLVSYPGLATSPYASTYKEGESINNFRLYRYTGISADTGMPTVEDRDGNGTYDARDYYFMGPRAPKFFGGVTNTLSWKGLSLDFTFQFVKQNGLSLLSSSYQPSYLAYNGSVDITRDYLALGDEDILVTTARPAAVIYGRYAASDQALVDASFIRLKNASISYTLPSAWLSRARIRNARVYVQGQNLWTITPYEGFDPESQGVATPPLRTITAGLQFTL